jgi:hypothetical protein
LEGKYDLHKRKANEGHFESCRIREGSNVSPD